jgi:transposase InsO family protein
MISAPDRQEACALIHEAVANGARRHRACAEAGIARRTLERWTRDGAVKSDGRPTAARPAPVNKLTAAERAEVLAIANSARFASLPPTQIVPILADEGRYLASESSFYRLLREENCQHHRGRARAPSARPVPRHCAQGPNELWAWDITWLPGPIAGMFFFLYLVLDVYSRKIVAHEVHEAESAACAARLIEQAVRRENVEGQVLVLHQDNGSPMTGSTYLAKLAELGIRPSYSRPGVSDDNAYAESLFRTCKYRPQYPGAFATIEESRAWVLRFARWYNHEHKHRNLRFVSPAQRHVGEEKHIFARRIGVYDAARARNPERWSRGIRNWSLPKEVWLNRPTEQSTLREAA